MLATPKLGHIVIDASSATRLRIIEKELLPVASEYRQILIISSQDNHQALAELAEITQELSNTVVTCCDISSIESEVTAFLDNATERLAQSQCPNRYLQRNLLIFEDPDLLAEAVGANINNLMDLLMNGRHFNVNLLVFADIETIKLGPDYRINMDRVYIYPTAIDYLVEEGDDEEDDDEEDEATVCKSRKNFMYWAGMYQSFACFKEAMRCLQEEAVETGVPIAMAINNRTKTGDIEDSVSKYSTGFATGVVATSSTQ
jgi:hypothetical protein